MNRLILSLWAPLLALLVACAPVQSSNEEAQPAPSAEAGETAAVVVDNDAAVANIDGDPDVICVKVKVTGSHIKKKRCTTRAQREAERKSAEDFMRRSARTKGLPAN